MSEFNGIYIALSGMNAHKAALEITGHNISNVGSKEYTRQQAVFSSRDAHESTLSKALIGGGVILTGPRRMADCFLEQRLAWEQAQAADWSSRAGLLKEVEGSINALNLPEKYNAFWEAWHNLALDPNLAQNRFEVLEQAKVLVDTLKSARSQLLDIQDQIEKTLDSQVEEVNILAGQLADLNKEIKIGIQKGFQPNDLLDRRTAMLKELVGITNAHVEYLADNTVAVTLSVSQVAGAEPEEFFLVNGISAQEIPSGGELHATGGSIFGLGEIRQDELQSYLDSLDHIAQSLVAEVNTLHLTGIGADGSTGNNFFKEPVTGVADLALRDEVENDPAQIAADGINPEDTGRIALEISNLSPVFSQKLSGLIGQVGIDAKNTITQDSCHQEMLLNMENMRAELSGVSLDEELAQMVRFQRAYQASAQVLSVMDEVLQTLINIAG
ncbi:MAG: flagellar hook-associated protein FlgK [Bacillota bacterium]|jgi:flagellar hook-associated protein 1 FlgK|nr:flagellar hook-associated protein FlgK [Clostridia bacterium]